MLAMQNDYIKRDTQQLYDVRDDIDESDDIIKINSGAIIRFFHQDNKSNDTVASGMSFGGLFIEDCIIPPYNQDGTQVSLIALSRVCISIISINSDKANTWSIADILEKNAQNESAMNVHSMAMKKIKQVKDRVEYCLKYLAISAGTSAARGGYSIALNKNELMAMCNLSRRSILSGLNDIERDGNLASLFPGTYWISDNLVKKEFIL